MKMDYIQEFVVLGRCLNFTRASAELFISQTTLSRHIALMEEELGQKLLRRDSHAVELTQAGQLALEHFRVLSSRYTDCLAQLQKLKNGEQGQLCLAECYYAADRYLNDILTRFKQTFPQVLIDLLPLQPYEVEQAVLEGRADLGLSMRHGQFGNESLSYHEISYEPFCCCMPSGHPLARRKKLRFSDLNGQIILLPRNEPAFCAYQEALFQKYDVHPNKRIYGGSVDGINATLRSEQALCLLSEHLQSIPHRGVSFVPLDEPSCCTSIVFIHRTDTQNPTVKLFLDMLCSPL